MNIQISSGTFVLPLPPSQFNVDFGVGWRGMFGESDSEIFRISLVQINLSSGHNLGLI